MTGRRQAAGPRESLTAAGPRSWRQPGPPGPRV